MTMCIARVPLRISAKCQIGRLSARRLQFSACGTTAEPPQAPRHGAMRGGRGLRPNMRPCKYLLISSCRGRARARKAARTLTGRWLAALSMFFAQMMTYWDAAQTICFCPEDDGRYYQDEVVILISLGGGRDAWKPSRQHEDQPPYDCQARSTHRASAPDRAPPAPKKV